MQRCFYLVGFLVTLHSLCMGQPQAAPPPGNPHREAPANEPIPTFGGNTPFTREDAEKQRRADEERWMTQTVPSEWSTYKREFTGDKGEGDARAALRLMSKARQARADAPLQPEKREIAAAPIGRRGRCAFGHSGTRRTRPPGSSSWTSGTGY